MKLNGTIIVLFNFILSLIKMSPYSLFHVMMSMLTAWGLVVIVVTFLECEQCQIQTWTWWKLYHFYFHIYRTYVYVY